MVSPLAGSTRMFMGLGVSSGSSLNVGVNPVFAEHHRLKTAAVEMYSGCGRYKTLTSQLRNRKHTALQGGKQTNTSQWWNVTKYSYTGTSALQCSRVCSRAFLFSFDFGGRGCVIWKKTCFFPFKSIPLFHFSWIPSDEVHVLPFAAVKGSALEKDLQGRCHAGRCEGTTSICSCAPSGGIASDVDQCKQPKYLQRCRILIVFIFSSPRSHLFAFSLCSEILSVETTMFFLYAAAWFWGETLLLPTGSHSRRWWSVCLQEGDHLSSAIQRGLSLHWSHSGRYN